MQYRITGLTLAVIGGAGLPGAAGAQTIDLSVTIPQMKVAEYHRPYVAVWLEKEGAAPRTLQVWYDFDGRSAEGAGTKWLRDMRQWWRVVGRGMSFPADGVTGATKAAGTHKIALVGGKGATPALTPGNYKLLVEAAREVGGREVVTVPFTWNGSKATTATAKGTSELGAVTISIKR
jgi:hypothetical protein